MKLSQLIALILSLTFGADAFAALAQAPAECEQWGVYELQFQGPISGNPFSDHLVSARFTQAGQTTIVRGFYDGDGKYLIRFMPSQPGEWKFTTHSSDAELDAHAGQFVVKPPSAGNHGLVHVANMFHFAYADGTPYKPLGTTCYAWSSQPAELQEQTLKTLASAPFNKLRMCVFPKRYDWNKNEPPSYAFQGTPPNKWDFTRFNPTFFRALETQIVRLGKLGIEVDLILLHPYDEGHWGFDRMPDEVDDRYLQYLVSRLAAYRNVWWSMANEWDFMTEKQPEDWDRMIRVVHDADPYGHLLSIHNGKLLYNHTNPLITHASIQNGSAAEEAGRAVLYRDVYNKPIVLDEVKYEGDIPSRWGQLSAEEMVHRCWESVIAGCYVTHGECFLSPDDVLWWAKGGVLKGQSPARLAFLRDVLATAPNLEPIDKWQYANMAGQPAQYYLIYFGAQSPKQWEFALPRYELADGMKFKVELLDTWNMTTTPIEGVVTVKNFSQYLFKDAANKPIPLPGKPWQAIRITRIQD